MHIYIYIYISYIYTHMYIYIYIYIYTSNEPSHVVRAHTGTNQELRDSGTSLPGGISHAVQWWPRAIPRVHPL